MQGQLKGQADGVTGTDEQRHSRRNEQFTTTGTFLDMTANKFVGSLASLLRPAPPIRTLFCNFKTPPSLI